MSEPITLYAPDGSEVIAYGEGQRAAMLALGYTPTPPEKPATVTVAEPEPPAEPRKVVKRPRKGL